MPCYHPLRGYWEPVANAAGQQTRRIIFTNREDDSIRQVEVPCGQCIGCRLDRSKKWALRCMHESTLHADSAFITLTYNDENLPVGGTLVPLHLQLFMKRYRKALNSKIRFFACGEYGEKLSRPHYHALIFGHDFKDKTLLRKDGDHVLFHSPTLEKIWGMGYCATAPVTFETAAYVARYSLKKVTGDARQEHYKKMDPNTGELFDIEPEFLRMSRKPGIARDWYGQFKNDVYPSDEVIMKGNPAKPPRYYDKLLELEDPELIADIRLLRAKNGYDKRHDSTLKRLQVREQIAKAKLSQQRQRKLDQ